VGHRPEKTSISFLTTSVKRWDFGIASTLVKPVLVNSRDICSYRLGYIE